MDNKYIRGMPGAGERVEGARVAQAALLALLKEHERKQREDERGLAYVDLVALVVPIHMRETTLALALEDLHRYGKVETEPTSGRIRLKWPPLHAVNVS